MTPRSFYPSTVIESPSGNEILYIGISLAMIGSVLVIIGIARSSFSFRGKLALFGIYCLIVALVIWASI